MGHRASGFMKISLVLLLLFQTVSLNAAPRIVRFGPRVRYVGVHGTYTFYVRARGHHLHYQWWNQEIDAAEGHAIPPSLPFDVNTRRLRVTDAQNTRDYNGWYWCVVTDLETGRTAVSPRGRCYVIGLPTIMQQPQSQTVPLGTPVTFRASVDAHAPVRVRYRWFHDDRRIPGARHSTLRIRHARTYRQGAYTCQVRTIGGTNYTSAAYLTVAPN
jgi:hypothetical protein